MPAELRDGWPVVVRGDSQLRLLGVTPPDKHTRCARTAIVVAPRGVRGIPHMLLVDGDTGLVLANKTIRGAALAPAIEKGLAGKKR